MTDPSFVTISEAIDRYNVSKSTLDRRRAEALDEGSAEHFMLRTKDGNRHREPSKELVTKLNDNGRVPEWLISSSWLAAHFKPNEEAPIQTLRHDEGTPPQTPPVTPRQPTSNVIELYEERIKELKEVSAQKDKLIERERDEKLKLLELAQADKQLFAKAAESLTQVLALPGIAAVNKGEPQPVVVNTRPNPELVKQKPRTASKPKATSKKNTSDAKKLARKTGILQRLGIKLP